MVLEHLCNGNGQGKIPHWQGKHGILQGGEYIQLRKYNGPCGELNEQVLPEVPQNMYQCKS